jgi:hypothetical protein
MKKNLFFLNRALEFAIFLFFMMVFERRFCDDNRHKERANRMILDSEVISTGGDGAKNDLLEIHWICSSSRCNENKI